MYHASEDAGQEGNPSEGWVVVGGVTSTSIQFNSRHFKELLEHYISSNMQESCLEVTNA